MMKGFSSGLRNIFKACAFSSSIVFEILDRDRLPNASLPLSSSTTKFAISVKEHHNRHHHHHDLEMRGQDGLIASSNELPNPICGGAVQVALELSVLQELPTLDVRLWREIILFFTFTINFHRKQQMHCIGNP